MNHAWLGFPALWNMQDLLLKFVLDEIHSYQDLILFFILISVILFVAEGGLKYSLFILLVILHSIKTARVLVVF